MKVIKMIFILRRVYSMYKKTMNATKLIGIGIATGMAMYCVGNKLICDRKCMKKKANKAIHAMGDIIDGVQYMFK